MIKEYLQDKRNELIWSLAEQDYSLTDIGSIFNLSKTQIHNIVKQRPADWKSPWVKRVKLKVDCVCPK